MSILVATGLESGTITTWSSAQIAEDIGSSASQGTAMTASTANPRSGDYHWRAPANASSQIRVNKGRTDARHYWCGFAVRFGTNFPSSTINIYSNAGTCVAAITSAGVLTVQAPAGTNLGSGQQLSLDTWYYIEIQSMIRAAAAEEYRWWLDGTEIGSTTAEVTTSLSSNHDIGPSAAYGTSRTIDFDDIYLIDDQGSAPFNTRLGPIRMWASMPTSDVGGGAASWTDNDNTTTNKFTSIDNRPPLGAALATGAGTADIQLKNAASTTTDSQQFNFESMDTAGVPSGDSVLATRLMAQVSASSTTGTTDGSLEIISGDGHPAVTEASQDWVPTAVASTYPTGWHRITLPSASNTFNLQPSITDRSVSPVVEIGKRIASTRILGICHLRMDIMSLAQAQTVNGGVASENDSAPAGSVTNDNVVNGGVASESDSAPTGSVLTAQPPWFGTSIIRSGSPRVNRVIRMTRTVQRIMGPGVVVVTVDEPQTVLGGRALESDSAPAGTVSNPATIAGGVALENDSAPAGAPSNPATIAGGTALENDTALAGTVDAPQVVAGGTALENDSAPTGTALNPFVVAGGAALESDSATAGNAQNPFTVVGGTALENDSAPAGTVAGQQAAASEASARIIRSGAYRSRLVMRLGRRAPAFMSSGAMTLDAPIVVQGGVARENDVALAGTVVGQQVVAGGTALESDSAPAGSASNPATIAGGRALESDSANAGSASNPTTVAGGRALENDSARAGTVLNPTVVFGGTASETNTARPGTVIAPIVVFGGTARENDAANAGAGAGKLIPDTVQPTAAVVIDRRSSYSSPTARATAAVRLSRSITEAVAHRETDATLDERATDTAVVARRNTGSIVVERRTTYAAVSRETSATPTRRSTTVTVKP